ncbi:transmembrane and coiled-coil domain-containing protein 4-like [Tropilaelaps mercedesae]|uniref:Transmembrane and coiled-coil domain-containing protein 4-like n=1 Tax=Tropilaelaps mercedesae TaxID=418985 RepID=A0A1V9Y3E1_9ACAR|nr:transmembrane and coiled-coil domain-containing protein 4-like [Tropilaelaps mercedesae]
MAGHSNLKPSVFNSAEYEKYGADALSRRLQEPFSTRLGEAGRYSYCALVALGLQKLFPADIDEPFRVASLNDFALHLNMPEQVMPVMFALLCGEAGGSLEPYISILRDEPALQLGFMRLIQDLVVFAVHRGVYDARMRVFLLYTARQLEVSLALVEMYENSVVQFLSRDNVQHSDSERREIAKRERNKKIKRYLMIGIATVGGGAVLGLTGGLAAPLVAAGAGAVIGGAGAAALGSTAGIALISSVMGLAGAGLTGYKMKKRVGEIEEFAFDELSSGHELHVTIGVAGWLTDDKPEAILHPWRTMLNSREQYVLRYETGYLVELGRAMDYLFSFAVSMAAQEALKYTVLSGLIAAVAWPATLVMVAGAIDNPWGVCQRRSAQVGRHLAEVLLQRQHGRRPVTLIGFSLGARVIYYCLKELSAREGSEGIIENAVLLGTPVPAHPEDWAPFGRIVAGNIVNGYCRGDWLLKFVYRTSSATMKIAGLQPIAWRDRRMHNFDLSAVVNGHTDYYHKMDDILRMIGVGTLYTGSIHGDLLPIGALKKSITFHPNWKPQRVMEKSLRERTLEAAENFVRPNMLRRTRSDSCLLEGTYSRLATCDGHSGTCGKGAFSALSGLGCLRSVASGCSLSSGGPSEFSLFRTCGLSRSTSGVSDLSHTHHHHLSSSFSGLASVLSRLPLRHPMSLSGSVRQSSAFPESLSATENNSLLSLYDATSDFPGNSPGGFVTSADGGFIEGQAEDANTMGVGIETTPCEIVTELTNQMTAITLQSTRDIAPGREPP